MRHFRRVIERKAMCVAITCDACKKKYDDPMEMQEFLKWKDTCGYGNMTFGDMSVVELDLCQYCVKSILGDYVRVSPWQG